jgi:2-polyprenyl-6-methoxyphenol hydroxylase-like FAD-dependent oxidoreductase
MRVVIVDGGIGGLSLGLALRERGRRADVFEQAPELSEIGAAVALSANSTREFARLGLGDRLDAKSTIPTELIYRDWREGRRIAAFPVRKEESYVGRFGAPYYGIHRADLQRILGGALGTEGLHLGCRLVNLVERADSIVLEFANGRVEHADLVGGADGVRSTVRRFVTGADDTVYSGTSAFRGIVPVEKLPSLPDPEAIQFWMGPDAHLLHYAIGGDGEAVNFFAVVEGPREWRRETAGWPRSTRTRRPRPSTAGIPRSPRWSTLCRTASGGGCSPCDPCCGGIGAGRSCSGRCPRHVAAPGPGREHDHRGRVRAGSPAGGRAARRPGGGARPLPAPAPWPYPEDPAQLLDDQ